MGTDASYNPWMTLPEKPTLDGLEAKWGPRWETDGTYRFDRSKTRDEIFAIDTPPPTVSGSLHMGSVFGYAQTDTIARQRRMLGLELFYPMGWDDNGLATERRVQNYFGVRCDPTLPVDPDFARNGYLYLLYSYDAPGQAKDTEEPRTGRLVRYTMERAWDGSGAAAGWGTAARRNSATVLLNPRRP